RRPKPNCGDEDRLAYCATRVGAGERAETEWKDDRVRKDRQRTPFAATCGKGGLELSSLGNAVLSGLRFLAEDRDHVAAHLDEPALDMKVLDVSTTRDPQLPGTEHRHERSVSSQDADLAVPRGSDDRFGIPVED